MLQRIPITLKALLATALVAITTWAVLDHWQTEHLQTIFQARLKEVVGEKAEINRVVFDQHIKMHQQAVNLLASQRNLLDYLEQRDALLSGNNAEGIVLMLQRRAFSDRYGSSATPNMDGYLPPVASDGAASGSASGSASAYDHKYTKILFHHEPPVWLPRRSVLRGMVPLRYVFLMNLDGRVWEVFQGQPEPPPPDLLEPSPLLRQLSHRQAFITSVDGMPFLLASETVTGRNGQPKALLMLANPLDDAFLASSQGLGGQYAGVVALLEGSEQHIIASNKPQLAPLGAPLEQLMDSYLVAGQSFFDYGASDLMLQLITLVSTESFESLTLSILQVERQQRFIVAFALVLACMFIMLWITHTIRQVTREIIDFSRNVLGSQPAESRTRDELSILRERFQDLSQEIVQTRDSLQAELEERRRAEIEVRKLSHAVEQSPAAVMICDLTGKITYVNSQFTRLTGYAAEEVLGRNPRFLQSGETPVAIHKSLWKTISSGNVWHGELHNRRKDGSTYWEMNTISHLHAPEQGNTLYMAIKEDITQRIAMEKALKHAREAAETANQVKNDFLSNISHELRTPLNIVTGCTALLLDQELGKTNKAQEKYLRNVMSSAERLSALISDLLDLSKVSSEQFILEKRFFDLPELVRSSCEAIMEQVEERGLLFSYQVEPDVPEKVKGDPVRLRQVLLHLLHNAIKFTPAGQINLIVARDANYCNVPGSVCFTVTDTGIGIPDEKQKTIFDLFMQADTSSTRRYDGTGLGLTIAKNLIELMGGIIRLKSKVDEGSVFSLTIPFALPVSTTGMDISKPLPPGLRTVVVGKNPVNRLILKKLLTSLGLEVNEHSHCNTLSEISEGVDNKPWDFVCLECASGGLDEITHLRTELGLSELPIILFSNLSPEYRERAEQLPGVFCLDRPMQRSQLCKTVRQVISKKTT